MYLNCTNMYPLGFNGLIERRLLSIFEPGVCPVRIMCHLKRDLSFQPFSELRLCESIFYIGILIIFHFTSYNIGFKIYTRDILGKLSELYLMF